MRSHTNIPVSQFRCDICFSSCYIQCIYSLAPDRSHSFSCFSAGTLIVQSQLPIMLAINSSVKQRRSKLLFLSDTTACRKAEIRSILKQIHLMTSTLSNSKVYIIFTLLNNWQMERWLDCMLLLIPLDGEYLSALWSACHQYLLTRCNTQKELLKYGPLRLVVYFIF